MTHPAVPKGPQTFAELVDELRSLAVQDSPQRAAVDRAFVAAATILKEQPKDAPTILRKTLPLVMHAHEHVARGAAEGTLKLLDLAAALPHDVIDQCMPVLGQLLDFSIGKWSFSQSTYRFARFAPLRRRILDAALEMAVAERNHTNPFVAVMALQDVITGLQKCGAFDEPHVDEAFARFVTGQSNADVKKALVAYLLESAPDVVGKILDGHPELFPSVEDLHVYQSEQRGHLTNLGPHNKRIEGLGQVPVANIELWLDEKSDPGRRMAAALAVPHVPDKNARERMLPALRRMLEDESKHVASVEGQAPPEYFWTRTVVLPAFTRVVVDVGNAALALEALRIATPKNVATTLLPLARACDALAAAQWLADVVALPDTDALFAVVPSTGSGTHSAPPIKWVAFETLVGLACSLDVEVDVDVDVDVDAAEHEPSFAHAIRAADAIVANIASCTTEDRRIVHGLWTRLGDLIDTHGPRDMRPFLVLLAAWPQTLALSDQMQWLRLSSYERLKKLAANKKHATSSRVAEYVEEAKHVLIETAKSDKPLAEALLISPP